MRGDSWQYLCDWGLVVTIFTLCVWILGCILGCVAAKIKDKTENYYKILVAVTGVFQESLIILLHMLTIN